MGVSMHVGHAGEEGAAAVLTAAELEARRWDGYRGLVAPQLRGEGSWPRASLPAAFELRVQAAVDAMLMRVPFWFTVCSMPSPICHHASAALVAGAVALLRESMTCTTML